MIEPQYPIVPYKTNWVYYVVLPSLSGTCRRSWRPPGSASSCSTTSGTRTASRDSSREGGVFDFQCWWQFCTSIWSILTNSQEKIGKLRVCDPQVGIFSLIPRSGVQFCPITSYPCITELPALLQEMYETYIKWQLNPFYDLNAPIRSEDFERKALLSGRKHLTG